MNTIERAKRPRYARAVAVAAIALATAAHPAAAGEPYEVQKVTFRSQVLGTDASFNVILPPASERVTPLPVLWVLHGALGNEDTLVPLFAGVAGELRPQIAFVLPDSCPLCNWTNGLTIGEANMGVPGSEEVQAATVSSGGATLYGVPWETFFLEELMPYVESHFPVRTDRAGRGITGHSMGGVGAHYWANKHPDLFAFAWAMSAAGKMDFVDATMQTGQPGTRRGDWGVHLRALVYGDPVLHEWRWMDADPWELAPNLVGQPIVIGLSAGDGRCSDDPEQPPGTDGGCDNSYENEIARRRQTERYSERLDELGVPHILFLYGPAGHRDLIPAGFEIVPAADDAFAAATNERPEVFQYRSMTGTFSIWGYDVRVARPNHEFLHLDAVRRGSLSVRGTGLVSIDTAPIYAPSMPHRVTFTNDEGVREEVLYTDLDGRLFLHFRAGADRYENQRRRRSDLEPEFPFPETAIAIEPAS